MDNVTNIMTKQKKVKHLFIYDSFENMDRVKSSAVKNLAKQKHYHKDLGSRLILEDRVLDFTFVDDNMNKLIGNKYQIILVYGDLDNNDKIFINTLLEDNDSKVIYDK